MISRIHQNHIGMKTALTIICLLSLATFTQAQTYISVQSIKLPDSLDVVTVIEPADIDNDGLHDLLIFAGSSEAKYLMFVKGDTANAAVLHPHVTRLPDYSSFVIADEDGDNQLDIVLSAVSKTVVLRNEGDFVFIAREINLPSFSALRFADLNGDGRREGVLSGIGGGVPFTRTYRRNDSGMWEVEHDSLTVGLSIIENVDLDGNGRTDLLVSGRRGDHSAFTSIFFSREDGFEEQPLLSDEVSAAIVDSDLDGRLDLILYGTTDTNLPVYKLVSGGGDGINDIPASGNVVSAFHADFNSDGRPDQQALFFTSANDTLNVIRFQDSSEEFLPHKDLVMQRFYDMDQDGDLDLVQLTSGSATVVHWYENVTTERNLGPGKFSGVAIPVYDRMLLYWDKPSDDHSVSASLTYDVYLEGNTINQDVSFDLSNARRIRTVHGNNGTNNFLLLRNKGEPFNYVIQAVDNSLYASAEGACVGNSASCSGEEHQVISVCTPEPVQLKAPDDALWFSFSGGFVGKGSTYQYEPLSKDTVFYLIPTGACPTVTLFEFREVDEVELLDPEYHVVCRGDDITFAINDDVTEISWSDAEGVPGQTREIAFTAENDKLLKVQYRNGLGCAFEKDFVVRISVPDVQASPATYSLMKGQSVQLNATGAETYSWSPSQGLNNAFIPNPVASPASDTRYQVTGTDSIGCTTSAVVEIAVEATGYIPSLFTPNGDGQNDILKVYGLAVVEDFSLRIVNREGKEVFRTNNLAEAIGRGWDGATNGIEQPNGVYFWKVEGKLPSGNRLLLNGKQEGSLVLLR